MRGSLKGFLASTAGVAVIVSVAWLVPAHGQVAAQDVNVVNTPFVRDAENPGRQSFQFTATVIDVATAPGRSEVVVFTVPPRKRAVLKYASVEAFLANGENAVACVETMVGVSQGMYALPLSLQGTFRTAAGDRADIHLASQEVQFYADGGTDVRFEIGRSSARGRTEAKVTLAGYYVDTP